MGNKHTGSRGWKVALAILLAALLLALIPGPANAAPAPKSETIAITWVQVGNDLQLTATTLKHGSAYVNSWSCTLSCNVTASTSLSPDGYYVSVATVSDPAPGDYTFTYIITMTAGKSDVQWTGEGSVSILVEGGVDSEGKPWKRIMGAGGGGAGVA